jgi:hypothetical protein
MTDPPPEGRSGAGAAIQGNKGYAGRATLDQIERLVATARLWLGPEPTSLNQRQIDWLLAKGVSIDAMIHPWAIRHSHVLRRLML